MTQRLEDSVPTVPASPCITHIKQDPLAHRLRKAWAASVAGYPSQTYFAPSAAKARYAAYLDLSDANDSYRLTDIRVVRARQFDVCLPCRHPVADTLTSGETSCLLHAYGANDDPLKAGGRSHFFTSFDDTRLCSLTGKGLMRPRKNALSDTEGYFYLTELGKLVALSLVPEYRT